LNEASGDGRTVFVSDWHLPPEHTAKTDAFIRFIGEVGQGAEWLFILGDLFNAWVGPRHVAMPGHAVALEVLHDLAASGTHVVVFRGNRDFLLDQPTLMPYGLGLSPGAWRGEVGGMKLMLSHGDELTENDWLHKAAKAVTSHFPVSTIVKAMPLCASGALAAGYRWLSANRRSRRKRRELEPAPTRLRAEFESGTDTIVIGHWHAPGIERNAFGLPGKTLVRLGECTETAALYAELSGGAIDLKQFPL